MSESSLKTLLQIQLSSDAHAVTHLPYTLSCLNSTCFLPSPHTSKWTTRVNSLLHSKDQGARWAGLCIANQTAIFSKELMIECAQSWLGVALPILARKEPVPTLKTAIRLLFQIFSAGTNVPEFQRQLATPNVPKFTTALLSLVDTNDDRDVKLLSLAVLTRLIVLYPTLHRAQHAALHSLSLRFLNGTAPRPSDNSLLEAASKLYTTLHLTGGKVGAVNLWRKSLDETLLFSREAFLNLRTTFPDERPNYVSNQARTSTEDPITWIPLSVERLKCGVVGLRDLLRTTAQRPVQVPVGRLIGFISEMLACDRTDQVSGYVDPVVRVMELSAVFSIWQCGCDILICLAKCARQHLTPSQTLLISLISYHLEQPLTATERLPFLRAVSALMTHTHITHNTLIPTRLTKAIIPFLTVVLATTSQTKSREDGDAVYSNKSKKEKKRARGYEGDEVFKTIREVVCPTKEDGEVLLASLDAIQAVLRSSLLTPAVQSITSRVLLSMLLALQQMPSASLSPDLSLHGRVLGKLQIICTELGVGTTSAMSRSLGLIIHASISDGSEIALLSSLDVQRKLDLMLHPRVPPLVRTLPHVESWSLFGAEESAEEVDAREQLGLGIVNRDQTKALEDNSKSHPAPEVVAQTPPSPSTSLHKTKTSTLFDPVHIAVHWQQPVVSPKVPTPTAPAPPELLPSSSLDTRVPTPEIISIAVHSHTAAPDDPMDGDKDEDEEEMPKIDVDSDSD